VLEAKRDLRIARIGPDQSLSSQVEQPALRELSFMRLDQLEH
jgi:hypothetical protein